MYTVLYGFAEAVKQQTYLYLYNERGTQKMKKFIEEFKAFALKGNVMDMAIGVIIGGAFASIVGALTDNIINPIIGCFSTGGLEGWTTS